MADFDEDDCLSRYKRTRRERPEYFDAAPGIPIEVLDDRAGIQAAQAQERAQRVAGHLPVGEIRVGILLEDRFIGAFARDAVRFADGSLGLYNRILGIDGSIVLPILGASVVFIRIFRHASRRWFIEFPGGAVEDSTHPELTAIEELREEIGAIPIEMHSLGSICPAPAISTEIYHLFAARIDRIGKPAVAAGIAEVWLVSVAEVEDMIEQGEIQDGPTICTFFRARMRGLV